MPKDNPRDKSLGGRGPNPHVQENAILHTRLNLAMAFQQLLHTAYDALLTHGVNYRSLPEYKDSTLLDEALGNDTNIQTGQAKIMAYIERVRNGINAAVRRKGLRRLDS